MNKSRTTCGAEVSEEARFCTSCGSPVSRAEPSPQTPRQEQPPSKTCATCSAEVSEEARFCTSCGSPVSQAEPLPQTSRQEQPSNRQYASTQAVPSQQASTPPPTQPTASMLVYLFADKLFPEWGKRSSGTMVPCKDVMVSADALAISLFAISFWNLREQGIVRLEPIRKKKLLLMSSSELRIVRVNQVERYGLEGEILNTLSDRGDDDVYSLIRRRFGRDYPRKGLNEWIISVPASEAIILGYISSRSGEKPEEVRQPVKLGGGWFKSGPYDLAEGLEPRCEKIATLEGRFNDLAARGQTFQTTEAELYTLLLSRCGGAISSRVYRSSGSATGGDGGG